MFQTFTLTGWWFQISCYFHHYCWVNGLKPPTSKVVVTFDVHGDDFDCGGGQPK